MPLASEIALSGRRLTAQEAREYGLINRVAQSQRSVVEEAIEIAETIVRQSPDGVIVTKHGLREAWKAGGVKEAYKATRERYDRSLFEGENHRIGE